MTMTTDAPDETRKDRPLLRVVIVIAPVVLVLGLFGAALLTSGTRDVGQLAPSFDLERLDGPGRLSSANFRGRPYVLNFWASWCIPCREEAPVLAKVVGSGISDIGFVGVNILDGKDQARKFMAEFGIRYPNVFDDGRVFRRLNVTGVPETLFVDGRGIIVGRYVGAVDEPTLRKMLGKLRTLAPGNVLHTVGSGRAVSVP